MKIPVTIITGFLGSGKTTLICNLLKQNPDRRLAVLVNEFGQISIDGTLLRTAGNECGAEIHDLPNGCICCTVKDDFLPMMKRLQTRKHEIDHILIETSGLALPTPVMRALSWPEVRNDFELDAVLAVVDTPQLLDGALEAGNPIPGIENALPETMQHIKSIEDIFNQQLESADVVVLNKVDELKEEALMKAEEMVREKAKRVRFLELAFHAELDTRLCLGLNLHESEEAILTTPHDHHGPLGHMPHDSDQPLEDQSQFDGHVHSGLTAHEHGEHSHEHFHEHDPGWQSFVLKCSKKQDQEKLKQAMREITLKEPILRAKGFVVIQGKDSRLVVQTVRSRIQTYFEKSSIQESDSHLVFIGYHPNRQKTAEILSRITGLNWD